jgi:predicted phage terminase large subunit-like protein
MLLNLWRGRLEEPELVDRVVQLRAGWIDLGYLVRYACVGKGGGGAQLAQNLSALHGIHVEILTETVDKVTNSTTARTHVQAGKVFFPHEAEWLAEFKRELLMFPNGEKDDQVDVLSHAANQVFIAGLFVGAGRGVDTSSERPPGGGPRQSAQPGHKDRRESAVRRLYGI